MTASGASESDVVSAIRRVLNFAGGFFAGLLLLPAAGLGVLAVVVLAASHQPNRLTEPFRLTTSGVDISRAGAAVVVVRRLADTIRQDCRDACDDLRLEDQRDDLLAVRVLDARGVCVACRDVPQTYLRPVARRWSVAGAPRLSIVDAGA